MQFLVIIFFVVIAIQVLYLFVFIFTVNSRRKEKPAQAVPVSVVVCAHDEEGNLKELIPLLLNQDHPDYEVIIVNDRSNDETYDLLLAETRANPRLRMVNVERTPPHVNAKKYGITLGIKAAKHEWILLTDADCRPEDNSWISTMSKNFTENNNFVIGYSPYYKRPGFLNAFIRFETIMTAIQYLSFALLRNPYMGVGRNLAYRKSLFLEAKGFNNFLNVTGGDDDLFVNQHARGKSTSVQLGKSSVMHSIPKMTWGKFFQQKVRHLSVGRWYRFKHRFLLGIFMFTWILSWLMLIPLAIFIPEWYWIAGAFAVRIILLIITVHVTVKQFGQRFEGWKVPFLDFLYSFYYLSTGFLALVANKVEWKN